MAALHVGAAEDRFGGATGSAVVVRIAPGDPEPDERHRARAASLPLLVIVVAATPLAPAWVALADTIVEGGDLPLAGMAATVAGHPLASVSLALLLRGQPHRTPDEGLVAESATYSLLQAGPEFVSWRSAHPPRWRDEDDGPRVRLDRVGGHLTVTLTRPHKRNALDRAMRDELADALLVPLLDTSVTSIALRGEGPDFCAGGDLDEFGSRPDPASAHLLRLSRHIGRLLSALAPRLTVYLHGACAGSGIELAAFAGRVVAEGEVAISLPELALGLVPGAGGTVSLPARVGRHRTLGLALSGASIGAATAQAWGLIDEVRTGSTAPPT